MTEHRTDNSGTSLSSAGLGPSYIPSPRKRIRLDDPDGISRLPGNGSYLTGKSLRSASSKRALSISPNNSGSRASLRPHPTVQPSPLRLRVSSPLQNRQSTAQNASESHSPRCRINNLPLQHPNAPAVSDNLSLKSLSLQEISGNTSSVSRDPKRSRVSDIHQSTRMQSGSSASTIASDTKSASEQNLTSYPEPLLELHPTSTHSDRQTDISTRTKLPFVGSPSAGPGQDRHTTPVQQPEHTGIHHGNGTPVSGMIGQGSSNRQRTTATCQLPPSRASRLQDTPRAPVPFRPPVSRHEHTLQNISMQSNGFPAQISGKPMSIKDRRAHGWFAQPAYVSRSNQQLYALTFIRDSERRENVSSRWVTTTTTTTILDDKKSYALVVLRTQCAQYEVHLRLN
jgi:hypothetical protein